MGDVLEFPSGAVQCGDRSLADVLREVARKGVVIDLEMTPEEALALADALDRGAAAGRWPAAPGMTGVAARVRAWWFRATGASS